MSIFYSTVQQILNERSLIINGTHNYICEIEMYWYDEKYHPDLYAHRHGDQNIYGGLYFHKLGKSYRGGNYKGLDLTLGTNNTYYGILIRSIINEKGELITGPSKVVDYILKMYNVSSIHELVGDNLLSFMNNWRNLILINRSKGNTQIYTGKRIGLSDKHLEWRDKNYRFSTLNNKIKLCTTLRPIN